MLVLSFLLGLFNYFVFWFGHRAHTGRSNIDLAAILVLVLGVFVGRGSARVAKLSCAIMGMYVVAVTMFLVTCVVRPDAISIRVAGVSIGPTDVAWAIAVGIVIDIWLLINIVLLIRALKSPQATT